MKETPVEDKSWTWTKANCRICGQIMRVLDDSEAICGPECARADKLIVAMTALTKALSK